MPELRVSFSLWNKASDDQKDQIIQHLKQNKLLSPEDTIVGDENIPEPSRDKPLYSMTYGEFKPEGWPGTDLCKIGCDAAAAAATASLTLTGPALAAAIAAIAVARDACRDGC